MHFRVTSLVGTAALVLAGIAAVPTLAAATSATAAWAPAASAAVHPGVQVYTGSPTGAQCTANFIYQDGTNTYLGQAAHCSSESSSTTTNGCLAVSLPLNTPVYINGATRPGTMVYNSWLAMQGVGETDANTCAYNDLALIKIDPADLASVNPSVPVWGGPVGVNTTGSPVGSSVYTYGNSSLRAGLTQLSPKTGVSIQEQGNGWSHTVYTATPGIPGDSGSGFLDAQGNALGVLSTVAIAPLTGSNNAGDLSRELAYAQTHGMPGLHLVSGTEPFNPNAVPIG